jgi:carbon storage regulator
MLILTRKPGEEIVIDGVIRVAVISVQGDRIRLGIVAPREVVVDRSEIHVRRSEFGSSQTLPRKKTGNKEAE